MKESLRAEVYRWGFFNGPHEPLHDDVSAYFTREAHSEMFGEQYEGSDEDLADLQEAAHELIVERLAESTDVCVMLSGETVGGVVDFRGASAEQHRRFDEKARRLGWKVVQIELESMADVIDFMRPAPGHE